jgi:hypothetical protein
MNRRQVFAALMAALALTAGPAAGQVLDARRMAMGGVMLAGGGPGSEGANVAYRAVPRSAGGARRLPLPIGVVPLLQDPPEWDPDRPDFNAYELANLVYDLPWNLALQKPEAPSGDIVATLSRNSLAIDLGEVQDLFPDGDLRVGAVAAPPLVSFGYRRAFVALTPLVHYENTLGFNDALHGALAHGEAFTPSTRYEADDQAIGQVAAGAALGFAAPLVANGDPRGKGFGLYVGARAKLLRGLAYGDADNLVAFTTEDTLFGSDPVNVGYHALTRDALPADGGLGRGFDVGAVAVLGALEFGVGVNDLATRIDWRVRETLVQSDSAGDYTTTTLAEDVPFTSEVPTTVVGSAAARLGRLTLAADVVKGAVATTAHAGAELWLGALALRGGAEYDANEQVQGTGGLGLRVGRVGIDGAVATHSRDVTRSRAVDLGVGLAWYPKREVSR